MCGIAGIALANSNGLTNRHVIQKMTDIIRYRGPDGEGFYAAPGIGMGIRRLSIIDLKTGDQPIYNEDNSIAVVCNGEIYNYIELRDVLMQKGHLFRTKSDVEVIVHLYEDYGVESLAYVRGMFAFALWDRNKRQLFLARDRLGIKPLHYAIAGNGSLYFASELKSILIAGCINREINSLSVKDLFTLGFVLAPKTLFKNIHRVLPGHYIVYKSGSYNLRKYWDLHFPRQGQSVAKTTEGEWAEMVLSKLKEAVRIHLRSDVPISSWLSAGIDSSSIVSLARDISSYPIQTYSLTFDESLRYCEISNKRTLDSFPQFQIPNQKIVCKGDHFNLFPKALWHQEDPNTSGVPILQMLLSEETAKKHKVVLTGEGSDEIFGGYPWFMMDKLIRPFAHLPRLLKHIMSLGTVACRDKRLVRQILLANPTINIERYASLIGHYHKDMFAKLFSGRLLNEMTEPTSTVFLDKHHDHPNWHPFAQLQYIDSKTRLTDFVTHGLDRLSMAHSLEARVPFLDHELVELCTRIPPLIKMHGIKEKHILRKAMKNKLPVEILNRKKEGLAAPTTLWLRKELPAFAKEALSKESLRQTGYFNPDFVARLLKKHRVGNVKYTRPLMAVLGVQVWDELFMRGCKE